MLSTGADPLYEALKITVFRATSAEYEDATDSAERSYMEMPYAATRQDERGQVTRGQFRYLGDAMKFVTCLIEHEVNQCLWRVKNLESGMLCARWRYEAGRVTQEMVNGNDDD